MNALNWDKDFALEQAADDMELLLELLEIFKDSFKNDFEQIQHGIENGAPDQVSAAAHSIKGAAASLGIQGINDVVKVIEEDSRDGNLDVAREKLSHLEALMGELQNI